MLQSENGKTGQKVKWRQAWGSFVYCVTLSWKASKTYTALQFICRAFTAFIPIAITWDMKRILDLFAGDGAGAQADFFRHMALLFALYVARLAAGQASTYVNAMQYDLFMRYIEQEMARMAIGMEMECFDNPKYYDAFESAKRDVYSVMGAVMDGVAAVSCGAAAASCAGMLAMVAPLYTVCILAASVPVAVSERLYARKLYRWGLDHMREERRMNYLYRVMTERRHAQEIRLFDVGQALLDRYGRIFTEYFGEKRKVAGRRAGWSLLLSALPEALSALALCSVGGGVLRGERTAGDFTLYAGLLAQFTAALQGLVMSVMGLYEKKLKIDHFARFGRGAQKKARSGRRRLGGGDIEIEFSHVSFRYPGSGEYALKDASFRLRPGEKVAVVGENGSGKTTLIKLLLRFYEPDEGRILVNGLPAEEYDIKSLRSCFSCFFQQADNYAFSLKENILISQGDAGQGDGRQADGKVWRALRMAGAEGLPGTLAEGLDTCLTRAYREGGAELSGGQSQKVALARMFCRDAPVMVMDEPTAALDPKAEYGLYETLRTECAGKSILFVSHRLSNVSLADRILVMGHGRILAQGTHRELMGACDVYRRLYRYQADKYVEAEKK